MKVQYLVKSRNKKAYTLKMFSPTQDISISSNSLEDIARNYKNRDMYSTGYLVCNKTGEIYASFKAVYWNGCTVTQSDESPEFLSFLRNLAMR